MNTCKLSSKEEPHGEYYRRIKEHPCFDPKAAHIFCRMHLAVAPQCNIQCNYCVREFDCVNESRPGITSKVLSPEEAIAKVREVIEKLPNIKVVGVAGPGEPLFNDETFAALSMIKKEFPDLILCLSTNGLLLPEKMDTLVDLNVSNLTVTMNTTDPEIGAEIYSYVDHKGVMLKGRDGAEQLLRNQVNGIHSAVKAGIVVKVNSVLIPTVNGEDIVNVARTAKELGAYVQNTIPLISQHRFSHVAPPSSKVLGAVRKRCEREIRQMRHCRQCRADAIGKLGKDLSSQFYQSEQKGCSSSLEKQEEMVDSLQRTRSAVCRNTVEGEQRG